MKMETVKIMNERYDAGLGIFNPISILWASDIAADVIGVEKAKAELKKINRQREKLGLLVAVHEFGHRLF
jgi:hypothetical protein